MQSQTAGENMDFVGSADLNAQPCVCFLPFYSHVGNQFCFLTFCLVYISLSNPEPLLYSFSKSRQYFKCLHFGDPDLSRAAMRSQKSKLVFPHCFLKQSPQPQQLQCLLSFLFP